MSIPVRQIAIEDANEVARIYTQSSVHLRSIGDTNDFLFSAEIFVRDGFSADPAFKGIVALLDHQVAGYLLYSFGYDTDRACRYLMVIDLAVEENMRKRGIGKALMDEASSIGRRAGCSHLAWWVHKRNELALSFYRGLGAHTAQGEVQYMVLDLS